MVSVPHPDHLAYLLPASELAARAPAMAPAMAPSPICIHIDKLACAALTIGASLACLSLCWSKTR